MLKKGIVSALSIALIAGVTVLAGDVKLEGVKCIVAPKPASAEKSADFKDGKVYFCCGNCAGKFAASPEKFTASANMQLVATAQYEQKGCPFSGGELNAATKTKVGDAEVSFCCEKCQAKVAAAEGKDQLEMVFAEKPFKTGGFAKVAAK